MLEMSDERMASRTLETGTFAWIGRVIVDSQGEQATSNIQVEDLFGVGMHVRTMSDENLCIRSQISPSDYSEAEVAPIPIAVSCSSRAMIR